MKLVSTSITPMQWMFMVAAFVQGSLLGISSFLRATKQSTLFTVSAAYILSLIILAFYLKLMNLNPGKNLIEINEIVFGKILGKIISVLYMLYFFSIVVMNTQDIGYFLTDYIMQETPSVAIVAPFLFACIFSVRKGIDSIAKYGALLALAQITVVVLLTVLILKDVKPANFLPVFDLSLKEYIQSTHNASYLAFLDVLALLMVIPNPANRQENNKGFFLGLTVGAAVLLIIVFVAIGVLGPAMSYFSMDRFETARYINVLEVFSRTETLFAFLIIALRFYKVSIMLYASALALAQISGLKSCVPLVSVMGTLAVCGSMSVFRSMSEASEWASYTAPFYSSFFQVVLPLLTLGICLIRLKLKKRRSP